LVTGTETIGTAASARGGTTRFISHFHLSDKN